MSKLICFGVGVVALAWLAAASWRDRRHNRRRGAARPLDTTALARPCSCHAVLADLRDRALRAEGARYELEALSVQRLELLRQACAAHDLAVPVAARDGDLLQALRAAAATNRAAIRRLQVTSTVQAEALAAVAALHLGQQVAPGQYEPRDIVRMVARDRARGSA